MKRIAILISIVCFGSMAFASELSINSNHSAVSSNNSDLNGDGLCDCLDVHILLDQFLMTGNLSADLNGDNYVNFQDLSIILQNYDNQQNIDIDRDGAILTILDGMAMSAALFEGETNYCADLDSNGRVDMADYDLFQELFQEAMFGPRTDLNADGITDCLDLHILMDQFLTTGESSADLNGDNSVNFIDLSIIMQDYDNRRNIDINRDGIPGNSADNVAMGEAVFGGEPNYCADLDSNGRIDSYDLELYQILTLPPGSQIP